MPIVSGPYALFAHGTTVKKVIQAALRKIGVLGEGETPSGAQFADALDDLNRMFDTWNAEDLFVYAVERKVWGLIAGTQSYSIGPGASLDMVRPTAIVPGMAFIEDTGQNPATEEELKIYDNAAEWGREVQKNVDSAKPHSLYYEPDFPHGTINLFPKPSGYNLVLYVPIQLPQAASVIQNIALPPGYAEAAVYNLALRLAPDYSRAVPPEVLAQALETKAALKNRNVRPAVMRCDPAIVGNGIFDIKLGGFR